MPLYIKFANRSQSVASQRAMISTLVGGIFYFLTIRQFGRGQYSQVLEMFARLFARLRAVE